MNFKSRQILYFQPFNPKNSLVGLTLVNQNLSVDWSLPLLKAYQVFAMVEWLMLINAIIDELSGIWA